MASITLLRNRIAKKYGEYVSVQEDLRAELSKLTGWDDLSLTHYSDGSISVFTDSEIKGCPLDVFLERIKELKV